MGRLASARAFDEVADEYDRSRPAYPDELVDRACEVAGIGRGDPVLEVGCGTGQLTRSLVARGLQITVVEPGKHLISLAERNVAGRGEVEFVNARFEDAELPLEHYRAIFSAAAFHWIDPDVGWQKAPSLLAPSGTLALIQYCGLRDPSFPDDQQALLSALARVAPELASGWPAYRDLAAIAAGVECRRDNISEAWGWIGTHDVARADAGRLFGDAEIATVPIVSEHSPEEITGLLRTMSSYPRLSQDQREALQDEHDVIHKRLGRPIRSSTVAVLVTAHRSAVV
ncbi:MAG TPA: methyltransferase domain-containing protein [Solirubrobacteraceae bacterium]|nr:methyltransferase domain-containing protein [Solirubrobacteraceae bacterium]